jgi:transcription initiation factor IIE alpha subunit
MKMSNYNKVIKNKNGITTSELQSLLKHVVEGEIYVCIDNGKGFPYAMKVEMISSEFGCLYITVKDTKDTKQTKEKINEHIKPKQR